MTMNYDCAVSNYYVSLSTLLHITLAETTLKNIPYLELGIYLYIPMHRS